MTHGHCGRLALKTLLEISHEMKTLNPPFNETDKQTIYVYTYTNILRHIHTCIYIYIYIYRERESEVCTIQYILDLINSENN